jgi:hypothetical protein
MKTWGCFGLILGGLMGLLLILAVVLILRITPPPPNTPQSATVAPDVTIFMSERSLSRIASETMARPVVIDFDSDGQMQVTTRTKIGRLEPVVHIGLLVNMQGTEVVSQLRWVRLGFLTIPERWLPRDARQTVTLVGQAIQNQSPPDFILLGLETTADGINFQLKWVGQ